MNSLLGDARCGCRLSGPRCRYIEEEEINWGWKTRLEGEKGKVAVRETGCDAREGDTNTGTGFLGDVKDDFRTCTRSLASCPPVVGEESRKQKFWDTDSQFF